MARTRHIVTPAWTEINGGLACVVTFDKVNKLANVEINDTPTVATALLMLPNPNVQIEQLENKSVWIRSDLTTNYPNANPYEVVVDTITP